MNINETLVTVNCARAEVETDFEFKDSVTIGIARSTVWARKDIAELHRMLGRILKKMPAEKVKPSARGAVLTGQNLQVFNHLRDVGSISGVEAAAVYKVRYLPRRIKDIEEKLGIAIPREMKKDHTGQRYTRYTKP